MQNVADAVAADQYNPLEVTHIGLDRLKLKSSI